MASLHVELGSLRFDLSSASQIRDALLASFTEADYTRAPTIMVSPQEDKPAWLWVGQVLRTRSDWAPAVGVALQHAVHDGNDFAKTALVDLLANERASVLVLDWTTPLAAHFADARSTRSNTGWGGGPFARLADVVADQQKFLATVTSPTRQVYVDHNDKPRLFPLTDEKELSVALAKTAAFGNRRGPPWRWLDDELLFRPWVMKTLPRIFGALTDESEIAAMLDWLSDERELHRFLPMLEGLRLHPPIWFGKPAATIPKGWRHPIRPADLGLKTWGEVVQQLRKRAQTIAAATPNVDLQPRP